MEDIKIYKLEFIEMKIQFILKHLLDRIQSKDCKIKDHWASKHNSKIDHSETRN